MAFNFSGVEEAKASAFTLPGTIDVFKIEKVEFNSSKNKGTLFMDVLFKRKEDGFKHQFYMTEKALGRVKSLVKAATGKKLEDEVNEEQLVAMLENKEIALRVTGKLADNGKGYPDLPYGDFAAAPAELASLTFSNTEKLQNARVLEAIAQGGESASENKPAKEAESEFSTSAKTAAAPAMAAAPTATPAPVAKPAEAKKEVPPVKDDDIF